MNNRYTRYAVGKALGIKPVYRMARALTREEIINADWQQEREKLLALRPYTEPMLPKDGRPLWPKTPEVDVSVVVPVYGVERFLDECLDSILNQQTTFSFEVIAVDDGSPDRCGEILDRRARQDIRLRVIHQSNGGCASARNTGLDVVRGGVIMFADPDDIYEQGAIQTLMDEYMKGDCDLVTANYGTMREDGSHRKAPKHKRKHGAPWGRAYSRELWRDLDYPVGNVHDDTVSAYCILPRCREKYIEENVYWLRSVHTSITHTCNKSYKGIDTYWVVEAMLSWCRQLGIALDHNLYEQTLRQLGSSMARGRVAALSDAELRVFFACCHGLLSGVEEFKGMHTAQGGVWKDAERALRTGDYALWKLVTQVR